MPRQAGRRLSPHHPQHDSVEEWGETVPLQHATGCLDDDVLDADPVPAAVAQPHKRVHVYSSGHFAAMMSKKVWRSNSPKAFSPSISNRPHGDDDDGIYR